MLNKELVSSTKSAYESELKKTRLLLDSLASSIGIPRAAHRSILGNLSALKRLLLSVAERKIKVSSDLDRECLKILQDFNFKFEYIFPEKMTMFSKMGVPLILLESDKVLKDIRKLIRKKISERKIR